ncbi:Pkinase-domain-containing protein [Backusella circina FSU 941]|nr:Pkinase-domain-containing protein [Backusella circina FSU 941]
MLNRTSAASAPKIDGLKPTQPRGPVKLTNPRQPRRSPAHYLVKDEDVPPVIYDNRHKQKYFKLEFLGEGGFARVFKVRNLRGEYLAAKIIAKKAVVNKKMKTKMLAEINIHRSLRHNSIVQYLDCFEDKLNVYIIMELCENKTMTDLIRKRRCITEDECRYFLGQILLAIRHMHANRIIHRDLKLSNIFLNKDMDPKIGDFGLAALLVKETDRKKTVCGTPNYIAPEILFGGHTHNQAVDMWSFGVLMYTLLIGQHPFHQHQAELIYKKVGENEKSSSYSYPSYSNISNEAKDLIAQLLVNNPDNRYKVLDALNHSFFSKDRIPDHIPVSALRCMPTRDEMFHDMNPVSQHVSRLANALEEARMDKIENEIDPINEPLTLLKETILDPRVHYTSTQQHELVPVHTDLKRHDSSGKQERDPSWNKRTRLGDRTNTIDRNNNNNNNNNTIAAKPRIRIVSNSTTTTTTTTTSTGTSTTTINPPTVKSTKGNNNNNNNGSRLIPKPKRVAQVYMTEAGYRQSIMASMTHNLRSAMHEHNLNVFSGRFDTNPIEPVWCNDNIFLQQWIDCTYSYGMAYLLSDNTVGFHFNDTTTMTTHNDLQFYYMFRNENNTAMEYLYHYEEVPDELQEVSYDLKKKMDILRGARVYMNKQLAKASEQHHEQAEEPTGVHLSKFIVTDEGVIFRLSNGAIQANLFQHDKLILYSKANKLIFIGSDRCASHYNILEALASNNKELREAVYYTTEILEQHVNPVN